MTLEKLRNTDESKLPDSDHPFKKDISAKEFLAIIEESAKETIKVKAQNPVSDAEWNVTKEQILKALNNTKNPY